MKRKSFKRTWSKLRHELTDEDLRLFYDVINIDDNVGRVLTCSNRDFNPKFMSHWFPTCRCHWNVLFPLWLLNDRKLEGKYAIITNEIHSALINKDTNEIFDPTYDANGSDDEVTLKQFSKDYKIVSLVEQMSHTDSEVFESFVKFVPKEQRDTLLRMVQALIVTT